MPGLKTLIALAAAGFALAAPGAENPTRSLNKRAAPAIGAGFTAQQTQQLRDAFADAQELASYAIGGFAQTDAIYAKYFDPANRTLVNGEYITSS